MLSRPVLLSTVGALILSTACADSSPTSLPRVEPDVTPQLRLAGAPGALSVGDTARLVAESHSPQSGYRPEPGASWASSDPSVLAVEGGLLVPVAPGHVTVTASVKGVTAQVALTVGSKAVAEPSSLRITPSEVTIEPGEQQVVSATLTYSNNLQLQLRTSVSWSSLDSTVATVQGGVVRGLKAGATHLVARFEEHADTVEVTVGRKGEPRVYAVPESIDMTGKRDVTDELNVFFATVPDTSTIVFPAGASYRIERTLKIVDRRSLVFEGNGARFFATIQAPHDSWGPDRTRSQWKIERGSDLTFRNLVVRGAHPDGGTGEPAYVADLEAQHGFDIWGVDGLELDRVTITDVYGDFVYVSLTRDKSIWSRNVWIHDSHFERNGRQGIAIDGSDGVLVERNYIGQTRRASVDLEPFHEHSGMRNIVIRNNTFGPGRLLWVAAGSSSPARIENVLFENNTLQGKTMNVSIASPAKYPHIRHANIRFIGNRTDQEFGSPVAMMRMARIDGVEIRGNYSAIAKTQSRKAVEVLESCNVVVGGNDFPGALQESIIELLDSCS